MPSKYFISFFSSVYSFSSVLNLALSSSTLINILMRKLNFLGSSMFVFIRQNCSKLQSLFNTYSENCFNIDFMLRFHEHMRRGIIFSFSHFSFSFPDNILTAFGSDKRICVMTLISSARTADNETSYRFF